MSVENQHINNVLHDQALSLLPKEQAMLHFEILENTLKNDILTNPFTLNQARKSLLSIENKE